MRRRRSATRAFVTVLRPKLVRLTATVLVLFGVGCSKKPADGPTAQGPEVLPVGSVTPAAPIELTITVASALPDSVSEAVVRSWVEHQRPMSSWTLVKTQTVKGELGKGMVQPALPNSIATAAPTFAKIMTAKEPAQAADAIRALDELEADGIYDHWVAAYLWRRTTAPSVTFLVRLEQHARVTDALVLARGQVKPAAVSERAWMSKAGPRREQLLALDNYVKDLHKTARDEYPRTEPGAWNKDGAVPLDPAPGAPAPFVVHSGKMVPLAKEMRFGRLDLLVTSKTKASFAHEWIGIVELPPGTTVSVWSLETYLSAESKKKVAETVKAALDGDEHQALALERAMPLVHQALRAALVTSPSAKGAPRLRTILALFDDVPMAPPLDPAPGE